MVPPSVGLPAILPNSHNAYSSKAIPVWIIGSGKDKIVADEIMRLAEGCQNSVRRTDLGDAVALLACAQLVVSNDSGLMHLAAALDRPMLALFGSSSPQFTPPLSHHASVIKLDLECSPCFKRDVPLTFQLHDAAHARTGWQKNRIDKWCKLNLPGIPC